MRSFFRSELTWIVLLTCILYTLTYVPLIKNFQAAPADRYYIGSEEYPIDLTWDLAFIQQGYLGHWRASLNYSSTLPHNSAFFKTEYILIGQIARIFHVDPLYTFWASRVIVSLAFLAMIYLCIRSLFRSKFERVIAYLVVLFGAYFPDGHNILTQMFPVDGMVFQRTTVGAIHYLLGNTLAIASVYFLAKSLDDLKSIRFFVLSAFCGVVSAEVNAPGMILVLTALPFYVLLYGGMVIYHHKKLSLVVKHIVILFDYALLVCASLLYVHYVMSNVWGAYNLMLIETYNPFALTAWQYIAAMGLTYVLSFFSLPALLKKGRTLALLLIPWLVVHPVSEFFFPSLLNINHVRFFLTPYFVVFGILATVGITNIAKYVSGIIPSIKHNLIVIIIVILVVISCVTAYGVSYNKIRVCFCNPDSFAFGYPRRESMDAIRWLRDNTKEQDIVLTNYYAGNLIPAFAGNRVYINWWYYLAYPTISNEVHSQMKQFYDFRTNSEENARAFVSREHIAYVVYSSEEHLYIGVNDLPYPFLHEVYRNGEVSIYRVDQ